MPCTKEGIQRLRQTTAKGWFYEEPMPKYKYIEDPSDFVYESNKNQTSQFNIPYHEMRLKMAPVFGPFSGKQLLFHYDWDTVNLKIDHTDEYVIPLKPGTSPDVFVRWCLEFVYSSERTSLERGNDVNSTERIDFSKDPAPASLSLQCLRTVFLNLEHIPLSTLLHLPLDVRDFFEENSFRTLQLNLWPSYVRGEHIILPVKRNMLVCELALLVREKLKLKSWFEMSFYKNCLPLDGDDVSGDGDDVMGCMITSPWSKDLVTVTSLRGPGRPLSSQKQVIVASVVGKDIKEVKINLSIPLRFLDSQLRQVFRLKPRTVLAIHLPDKHHNLIATGRAVHSCQEEESVKRYVANGKRNFPTLDGKSSTSDIGELYKQYSIYGKPLRDIGFYPGIFVEVFEVTGPSIPVMYFGEVTKTYVLDVNPDWPIDTFLRYAHVSMPGTSKIRSVDYIREFKDKKVQDILNMMRNLWRNVKKGGHLEYLRIRS